MFRQLPVRLWHAVYVYVSRCGCDFLLKLSSQSRSVHLPASMLCSHIEDGNAREGHLGAPPPQLKFVPVRVLVKVSRKCILWENTHTHTQAWVSEFCTKVLIIPSLHELSPAPFVLLGP